MVRTKNVAGASKGKEVASSSRAKRGRVIYTEESEDEEVQMQDVQSENESDNDSTQAVDSEEEDYGDDGLPIWRKNRRLSSFKGADVQAEMYLKKMKASQVSTDKLMICERQIYRSDFERFGVVECFTRLGWEQHLSFNNEGVEDIYVDAILEWMSTLKKEPGDNPPVTTQLTGKVNGKTVSLSFFNLNRIAHFDSGTSDGTPYTYPTDAMLACKVAKEDVWRSMIYEMFQVPEGINVARWSLDRANLKPLPKLLLIFLNQNVLPRMGDKAKVRLYEVMVLHALVTGTPALSARHLILWSIWESREKSDRKSVPHCRLLSKFFRKQNVLPSRAQKKKIPHVPFKISNLPQGWSYERSADVYKLVDRRSGRYLEVQEGISGMREGDSFVEEGRRRDSPVRGDVGDDDDDPYHRRIRVAVAQAHPVGFTRWSEPEQRMFDRQSEEIERNRMYMQHMMYSQEFYRNQDYMYRENISHREDYMQGLPYTPTPPSTDWQSPDLPPYSQTQQAPYYPQSTPSVWLPTTTAPSDEPSGSHAASADAFDMGDVRRGFFESIFGQPYPGPPSGGY